MRSNTRLLVAAFLLLALAASGLWYARSRPDEPATGGPRPAPPGGVVEVQVTPLRGDRTGMEPQSGFRLVTTRPVTAAAIQRALTVEPAVALNIWQTDQDGREFAVTPTRALDANRVYRLHLKGSEQFSRSYQWAFQTQAAFAVLGSLPADQGSGVPLDTGIEISFSHEDFADPTDFFSITPSVRGRFERHKRTLLFVPQESLQPSTIYTVTVKAGLGRTGSEVKLAADHRFAFETLPQNLNPGGGSALHIPPEPLEFGLGIAPYFRVEYYNPAAGSQSVQADVTVHRYSSAQAYASALARLSQVPHWAYHSLNSYREDTAGLTQVVSFQAELREYQGMGTFLAFPDPFAAGFYLAEVTVNGQSRQGRFQVSNLAAFLAGASNQSLVWLNDLITKAPVAGATVVELGSRLTGLTGSDGVALLPAPAAPAGESPPPGFYHVTNADQSRELIISDYTAYFRYWNQSDAGVRYWKYLYLDRPLYKPDDTLNLWGIVRPREPGAPPVSEVTAEVSRAGYQIRGDGGQPILISRSLPAVEGSFTGSIALPNLRPDHYYLRIRAGEEILVSSYFEVQTYTKPAYQISVTPDRRALFAGERITYTIKATFFESTPVPGLPLRWTTNRGSDLEGQVVTDQNGEAVISLQVPVNRSEPHSGWSDSFLLYVRSSLPEAGEIVVESAVHLFHRDLILAPQAKVEAGQAVVGGQLNRVSLEQLNLGNGWEHKGAPAPGVAVAIEVIEQSWRQIEDGEYYDFINKRVQKRYRSEPNHRTVGSFTAMSDSEGRFSLSLPADPTKAYLVRYRLRDSQGGLMQQEYYYWGQEYREPQFAWTHIHLGPEEEGRSRWAVGEEIVLLVREGRQPVAPRPAGFLFLRARLGLQGHQVQDSPRYQLSLREQDLPATNLRAVYFDGRTYQETSDYAIRVDPQSRTLKVTVTPDQERYRPGEQVNLAIAVTDRHGRPVQAQVNLSVVDEALFALRQQQVDLPERLYGEYIPSGILRTRSTHQEPLGFAPGGKGGDGPRLRTQFTDSPYFATVATDAAGKATASFAVPDNLTSWRLTYQAVAPATLEAASGTLNLPVQRPFFVELVLAETYLTGDAPVLTMRSYGTGLKPEETVIYQVSVTGPDGATSDQTVSAPAYALARVELPMVRAGGHTITVEGEAGSGLRDGVQKQYTGLPTYLKQTRVRYQLLSEQARVSGAAAGLTMLSFADHERSRYLQLLHSLRWQGGSRFEQRLVRLLAAEMLERYFEIEDPWKEPAVDFAAFQRPNGGVAILPYADADLLLSVLAADLVPDRLDRGALAFYFDQLLADEGLGRERAAQALYGMAALGQPVLSEVQRLLADPDLSMTEEIFLALAAATLGDLEGIRPLYFQLIAERYEEMGANARMMAGRDADEIAQVTALTAMLAAKLGQSQAAPLIGYLLENPARQSLVLLEPLLAAQAALPRLPSQPVAFTYKLEGKEQRQELRPGEVFHLPVAASALAGLQFSQIQGRVGLTVTHEESLTAAELKQEPGFALSRRYAIAGGGETIRFKAGDLVQITLTYKIPDTAPAGPYEIADYLPAGLQMVRRPWQQGIRFGANNDPAWPMEINGQRVTFWASKDGWPISYYARVISPGQFRAEHPVLQHQQSGRIYGLGPQTEVEITR